MGQKKIPFLPGVAYHVYNRGNAGENLFRETDNYRYFLQRYRDIMSPVVETHAWCLMPNHFHLAVTIKPEEVLQEHFRAMTKKAEAPDSDEGLSLWISKTFGRFFNAYSSAFNKMYQRRGRLFYQGVNRKAIDGENHLSLVIDYIHNNPVKHGFASEAARWEHSSIHSYPSHGQDKSLVRVLF